eukprot:NODE_12105_length_523_cov_127.882500_g11817_i0.p1 GENE.NODE_12105_length_523_cov_127.882500_g11817_i0~~NODE_12105_length_523_cov_127.882500_g11817_i0.p1  ORF type:complete len:107 (-),score=19.95 NODE_12105_length_523_cov_127.882500_g11817_i0:138-458(-)
MSKIVFSLVFLAFVVSAQACSNATRMATCGTDSATCLGVASTDTTKICACWTTYKTCAQAINQTVTCWDNTLDAKLKALGCGALGSFIAPVALLLVTLGLNVAGMF